MILRAGLVLTLLLLVGCSSSDDHAEGSCVGCHRPDGTGIEDPHPTYALSCEACHGGDPSGQTRAAAHVAKVDGFSSVRALSANELDAIDPDYVRFINPSDLRVAAVGCGAQNPNVDGSGCHQMKVDRVRRSTHATLAGIVTVPRYNGSVQSERLVEVSATNVNHPEFDPATAPPYTVSSVTRVVATDTSGFDETNSVEYLGHTMAKRCTKCHLGVYGGGAEGKEFGNYRSTGCAACHMVYDNDGLSRSGDPLIEKDIPAHPIRHELTTAIPDAQCEHCHWRGNRVGTAYKGWRERPTGSRDDKTNTVRNAEPLHTRPTDFFIIDENDQNDVDETPPDIHYQKGMGCIDCHLGSDNHGDGWIHTTMDTEGKIECVDCHGTFDAAKGEPFVNSGAEPLPHLSRAADGSMVLTSLVDGSVHPVTQVSALRALQTDAAAAHDPDAHGELECYACHTAWSQNCYGCHTNLDLRRDERDPLTGAHTPGSTSGNRDVVTIDNLHLAINTDGKIGVFMVQNMFFSVIVPCDPKTSRVPCDVDVDGPSPGRKLINSEARISPEGKLGFSWGPGVPHTTADKTTVQPCARCHPKEDGSNLADVRLVYGFGNGQYTFVDGETGIEHDLTKMIEADGTPVVAFAHVGTGPIPIERIQKALDTKVP